MFENLPTKFRNNTSLRKELDSIRECRDANALLEGLRQDFEITTERLILAAARVRQLEELGIEVSIHVPAMKFVRKIAYEQMLPELFVELSGKQMLLDRASQLPIPEQRKIAENKPMKVMEVNGDFRMVPPQDMTAAEIQQVFGKGELRSETEQVGWLRQRMARRSVIEQPEVTLNRRNKSIYVSGARELTFAELTSYVTQLGGR